MDDSAAALSGPTDALSPWPSAPDQLSLSSSAVHVWRASLEQPPAVVENLRLLLSSDEQARAARFHFDKDRRHFISARGILKQLLGRYLEIPPQAVRFVYGAYGKPRLVPELLGQLTALKFNLAHSAGLAVYACTRLGEIGVDLERIKPEFAGAEIARRFFSTTEMDCLDQLSANERALAFFTCWTRKEAFIKAKGMGLSLGLDQFDVTLTPHREAKLLRTRWDESEAERWSLSALDIGVGYVGAVAVEAHDWQLHCWEFRT